MLEYISLQIKHKCKQINMCVRKPTFARENACTHAKMHVHAQKYAGATIPCCFLSLHAFLLGPFSITRTVSFNFFTPFIAMKKRRSNNLFGGPSSFSGATLPTYGEVGKQWAQTRMDLESQNPGARITNVEVAKQVCH